MVPIRYRHHGLSVRCSIHRRHIQIGGWSKQSNKQCSQSLQRMADTMVDDSIDHLDNDCADAWIQIIFDSESSPLDYEMPEWIIETMFV